MPKRSPAADRQTLAALLADIDSQPAVVACKALLKAAFLFVNGPDRPYHEFGMSVSEVDVLAAIGRSDAMALTCSEIAEATLITKGGITGILDRLAARGLVQRVASRNDRRSIVIQLTEKGVEFGHVLFSKLARNDEEVFAKVLKPEQVRQIGKLLNLFIRSLEVSTQTSKMGASDASELTHGHERI